MTSPVRLEGDRRTLIGNQFSFLILDSALNPLATDGPTGAEFVSADFTSTAPVPTAYSGTGSLRLLATMTPLQPTQVIPEPGTLGLLSTSLLPLVAVVARHRRAQRA